MSHCGFIRYLIKYEFATNDDSGISQCVDESIFTIGTFLSMKVNDVANNYNVVNDTHTYYHARVWGHRIPFFNCDWDEVVSRYVCRVSHLQELTVIFK